MQRDIPSSVLQSADCRTGHTLCYLCYALTSTLMCCVSGSPLHHSCILAGDFGHGSVTVIARGLQAIRLLRNMQKTISSTFPVYHQLSVACTLHASPKRPRSDLQQGRSRPRWARWAVGACPKVTDKVQLPREAEGKFPLLEEVPTSRT